MCQFWARLEDFGPYVAAAAAAAAAAFLFRGGREYVQVSRAVVGRDSGHRKVAFLCAGRRFEFTYT